MNFRGSDGILSLIPCHYQRPKISLCKLADYNRLYQIMASSCALSALRIAGCIANLTQLHFDVYVLAQCDDFAD